MKNRIENRNLLAYKHIKCTHLDNDGLFETFDLLVLIVAYKA